MHQYVVYVTELERVGDRRKHPMVMELLEALLMAWLSAETLEDIASDPEKVRLLKRVAEEGSGAKPTPFVRDIYREVFLRDVWTRREGIAA